MTKTTRKLLIFLVIVALAGAVMVGYKIYDYLETPLFAEQPDLSDEILIDIFHKDPQVFEQLYKMVTEDNMMTHVDNNWTEPANLPKDRVAEYRKLFKEAGIYGGVNVSVDRKKIEFITSAQGWVASGSSKGYMYLTKMPEKLVDNIDVLQEHSRMDVCLYRHIEGNWYLYYVKD